MTRNGGDPNGGEASDVRLWLVPLGGADRLTGWALAALAAEERRRAKRFVDRANGARYAVTRAVLRRLLSQYTELGSAEIGITEGAAGKPTLAGGESVHFNVSHSGEAAVIAISPTTSVGVDIEWSDSRRLRARDIVTRVFHAEEKRHLTALSRETLASAVLRCWTIKEAVGKALGLDLGESLESVVVDADPTAPPRLLRVTGDRAPEQWSVRQMSLLADRALVAVAAPEADVRIGAIRRFPLPAARPHLS